jgi:hypothetical protein
MGYPTKVQLIKRKASEQWYINFPSAVAQAMEFRRGEVVEWVIEDKARLTLKRPTLKGAMEKKRPPGFAEPSTASGSKEPPPSGKSD